MEVEKLFKHGGINKGKHQRSLWSLSKRVGGFSRCWCIQLDTARFKTNWSHCIPKLYHFQSSFRQPKPEIESTKYAQYKNSSKLSNPCPEKYSSYLLSFCFFIAAQHFFPWACIPPLRALSTRCLPIAWNQESSNTKGERWTDCLPVEDGH